MLRWAVIFLFVAIVLGVLGFGVRSGTASEIARVFFMFSFVGFIVSLVWALLNMRKAVPPA